MVGLVQILGGLALFLYGIDLLSAGIEKLAGDQIQTWLDRVTSNRFKSAIFGAAATALLQSSSLLMITMIGLINANIMTVSQAIGVMLGQEIGTTMTAQIVAFNIGNFQLIFVIVGLIFLEFFKERDWKKYGEISMGLGVIFIGMGFMSSALDALILIPWVADALLLLGEHIGFAVLGGVVLTSVIQSSTAVTSLVVAMGISGAITLPGAIGVILGANIGTCFTGFIASLRLSHTARQASIAQIIINITGVLVFLPFIKPFSDLIQGTSASLPRQIANAHSVFNVAVSVLLFPFVKQIADLANWLVPGKPEEETPRVTQYIDEKQIKVPTVAISEARRELYRLGKITAEMVELSCQALIDKDMTKAAHVIDLEESVVDRVTDELETFVNTLMHSDLSHQQQRRSFEVKNLLVDIERVGDMAEDIAEFAQERVEMDVPFTDEAIAEYEELWHYSLGNYRQALEAFRDQDRELAKAVCEAESKFDSFYLKARQRHLVRLQEGTCHPQANVIYTETLRLLERISDHADNIGESVMRN